MDRTLDIEVAARFFGWTDIKPESDNPDRLIGRDPKDIHKRSPYRYYVLHYSTDVQHAREIMGKFKQLRWNIRFTRNLDQTWSITLSHPDRKTVSVTAATGPLTVCQAALKTLET